MPIAPNLPPDIQLLLWGMSIFISLLSAISCFWIIRFVKQSDEKFNLISKELGKINRHMTSLELTSNIHDRDIQYLQNKVRA